MVFEGEEAFGYDINDVWTALHDTKVLTKALPGCKSMTPLGNNSYLVALSLGVAAVKGDYEGTVKVTDVKALSHYNIEGEGRGAPGFVKLRMDCWFVRQDAGTTMKWKCDATVGGLIASIGGKVLSGISKFMAAQFFTAFKKELKAIATPTGPEPVIARPSHAGVSSSSAPAAEPVAQNWLARIWTSLLRLFSRERSA